MKLSPSAETRPLSPHPGSARHQLRGLLVSSGWEGDVDAVVLAVHEAMMNAMHHAGGATSATAALDGDRLVVEVRDCGPGFGFDGHAGAQPDPMAERGRGLWLISRIADNYEVERTSDGTCLRLAFCA